MSKYVAFLRGINVGGHKTIKMAELRSAFESLGFENVRTILASGNVFFESPKSSSSALTKKIEENLEKTFGYKIGVLIRTIEKIQSLADLDPFKDIDVTKDTRLYVTFLSEKPKNNLKIPYESPEKDFKIISVTSGEICSVLILTPNRKTPELMKFLEKEFSRNITTRNWNTVEKLLKD